MKMLLRGCAQAIPLADQSVLGRAFVDGLGAEVEPLTESKNALVHGALRRASPAASPRVLFAFAETQDIERRLLLDPKVRQQRAKDAAGFGVGRLVAVKRPTIARLPSIEITRPAECLGEQFNALLVHHSDLYPFVVYRAPRVLTPRLFDADIRLAVNDPGKVC